MANTPGQYCKNIKTPLSGKNSGVKNTQSSLCDPSGDSDKSLDTQSPCTSRYGRAHKPKVIEGFLSTDKKVGAYLKVSPANQLKVWKMQEVQRTKLKKFGESPIERKKYKTHEIKSHNFSSSSKVDSSSLNTTPLKLQPDEEKALNVKLLVDDIMGSPVEGCDWLVGDLAWARVGAHPFWPCIISLDPENNQFTKTREMGRHKFLQRSLHVQFFGDNGRRSWVYSHNVTFFHGRDAFNKAASLIPPKENKNCSYTVRPSSMKMWDLAVREAESIMDATREERVMYCKRLYPMTPTPKAFKISPLKDSPEQFQTSKTSQRRPYKKRKLSTPTSVTPKQIKLDETVTQMDVDEPEKLPRAKTSTPNTADSTSKLLTLQSVEVQETKPVKTSKRISMVQDVEKVEKPARRKMSNDDEDWSYKGQKKNKRGKVKEKKKKQSKLGPGFYAFCSKNCEHVSDEHPELSVKEVERYLEKLWKEMDAIQRARYVTRLENRSGGESASEGETSSEPEKLTSESEESESQRPLPSTLATSKHTLKRGGGLFSGAKAEKVCQICEKPGDTVRCRGPCCGNYHLACFIKPKLNKSEETLKSVEKKRKRGRPKKSDLELRKYAQEKEMNITDCSLPIVETKDDLEGLKEEMKCYENSLVEPKSKCDEEPNESLANLSGNCIENEKVTDKEIGIVDKESRNDESEGSKIEVQKDEEKLEAGSTGHKKLRLEESRNDESEGSKIEVQKCEEILEAGSTGHKKLRLGKDRENSEKGSDVESLSSLTSQRSVNSLRESVDEKKKKSAKGAEGSSESGGDEEEGWRCPDCVEGRSQPCFVCRQVVDKMGNDKRLRCHMGHCGKVYHVLCLKQWPQTILTSGCMRRASVKAAGAIGGADGVEDVKLTCPQHACHTCISDNPAVVKARFTNDRLVRCMRCPTSYHYGPHCLPAGTVILTNSQIICPKHYKPQRKGTHHVNASWCFICASGGSLICCDLCPTSFHADCLKLSPPEGSYICEDCETGRFPLYGEVVWVKLGSYRWWPAQILFPNQIPDNILNLSHTQGEFAVRFFGSHDHYWLNRGRVFLYQEGDTGKGTVAKNHVDTIFMKAIEEAAQSHATIQGEKEIREAEARPGMRPPNFVKIKNNKPVGKVRMMEMNVSNMTPCECDSNTNGPCSQDTDCLNRLLMVECNPLVCPAGDQCHNQNFEKRLYPPLMPYRTEARGWGLKTLAPLKKGDFVIEYVGEMIDEAEYRRRLVRMRTDNDPNYYFLTIDKDRMLDAGPKGNVARFMNHSCQPNCETQKWTVNNDTRVGLFALCDIPANTELVFNYNLESVGSEKMPCMCGAPNCSGFIGVKVKGLNEKSEKSEEEKKNKTAKKREEGGKRVKSRIVGNTSSRVSEDLCFMCGEGGELLLCDNKKCTKGYHLTCLKRNKWPNGNWVCPWHHCSVCNKGRVRRCSICVNSYCQDHADGNISLDDKLGLVCLQHNVQAVGVKEGGIAERSSENICSPVGVESSLDQSLDKSKVSGLEDKNRKIIGGHEEGGKHEPTSEACSPIGVGESLDKLKVIGPEEKNGQIYGHGEGGKYEPTSEACSPVGVGESLDKLKVIGPEEKNRQIYGHGEGGKYEPTSEDNTEVNQGPEKETKETAVEAVGGKLNVGLNNESVIYGHSEAMEVTVENKMEVIVHVESGQTQLPVETVNDLTVKVSSNGFKEDVDVISYEYNVDVAEMKEASFEDGGKPQNYFEGRKDEIFDVDSESQFYGDKKP